MKKEESIKIIPERAKDIEMCVHCRGNKAMVWNKKKQHYVLDYFNVVVGCEHKWWKFENDSGITLEDFKPKEKKK